MNESDLQGEIREFIVQNFLFGDAGAAPASDQLLVKTGLVDSTGILEIVGFLETRWGIATRDEELAAENFGSVASIARFVASKASVSA